MHVLLLMALLLQSFAIRWEKLMLNTRAVK